MDFVLNKNKILIKYILYKIEFYLTNNSKINLLFKVKMPETSKILIISSCAIGVFAFLYIIFINKIKPKNKDKEKEKPKTKENLDQCPKQEVMLQETRCFSIELSKKIVNSTITNNNDISRQNVKSKLGDKNYKESTTPPQEESLNDIHNKKKSVVSAISSLKKKFKDCQQIDEEKFILYNSTNDQNVEKQQSPEEPTKKVESNSKKFLIDHRNFHADNTLLNIVSDLKTLDDLDPEIKRRIRENLENQTSLILDKPIFIAGDIMYESEGYLEEDDYNSNEKVENLSESFFDIEEKKLLAKNREEIPINYDEKIKNLSELKNALNEKNKGLKYKLFLEEKFFVFKDKNEAQSIIKAEEFVYILKHLYHELHSKLIEMNDTFDEERRRYFQKDEKIYISIIKYHLQKKEEFFLSVVSNLMGRISISQEVLDKTFYYYFNLCDQNLNIIIQIKESYEEVYNAGLKYSIAPKNLTKNALRKIYLFQLDHYEKFSKKGDLIENDVIDIMVIDKVYAQFGLDSECIKAAAKKYKIHEDPLFSGILQKISSFQNNSFII